MVQISNKNPARISELNLNLRKKYFRRKHAMVLFALSVVISMHTISSAQQALPDVTVETHNGRPVIFIDENPVPLAGFAPFSARGRVYERSLYERYVPELAGMGFNLYLVDGIYEDSMRIVENDEKGELFWLSENIGEDVVIDFDDDAFFPIGERLEIILEKDPEAYIIVRFNFRAPDFWREKNPHEYFINETGEVIWHPSLASDHFWETAAEYCAAVVRYIESQKWAGQVIGYLTYQLTEGTHGPVCEGWLFDHNPRMLIAWRRFLEQKYQGIEELREAYRDPALTFQNVELPACKLRASVQEVSSLPYWQPAEKNQKLRDYLELTKYFWHLRFRQIGQAMDSAVNRNVIMIHDALKQPMLGWNIWGFFDIGRMRETSWHFAWPEVLAGSGHIGVAELLDNTPGFDGLMTPHDYQARGIGGIYEPEGIADSLVLREKYKFIEMDTRVSEFNHRDGSQGLGSARNERELAGITWRNLAASITRGINSYWHHAWTMDEWIFSDINQEMLKRQAEFMKDSLEWQHETMPGIAVILDDSAVFETSGSGHFFNEAINWEYKTGLARCGVPFRIYLFEDLYLDNFPEHKVFYFPNLFRADSKRLEILEEKVFRDGNVVVWGPGSGISDGKTISTESASKLTGFTFGLDGKQMGRDMIEVNTPRRVLISNFEHPITRGLDADVIMGGSLPYGPALLPIDGTELGIAWIKGGQNHSGLSVKDFGKGAAGAYTGNKPLGRGDFSSVFTVAVPIPANIWRNIARYAGAHVYIETNDVLMADRSIVALHSLQSGEKTIRLPGTFHVKNYISGEIYSEETNEIIFEHESPDTHIFLLKD